jgi:sugar/nucleoside kinase (ribokinase family)
MVHRTAENRSSFDILGLGSVAVDDLIYVESYPPPDTKTPVLRRERQGGGLTGTALVAASRLGSTCAYAGVLGNDELSEFVVGRFQHEGIDVTHLVERPDARPIHSLVVVDVGRQTRTIFFDRSGAVGADRDLPEADVIRSTRILFVDHFGMEGMIRAARVARASGIPVVADLERDESPHLPELLSLADHPILSRDFARYLTGASDPASAVRRLWTDERKVVVVTCGVEGCWYISNADPDTPQYHPAFHVKVVDTTGCGDVFHGAYASTLARGLDLPERIRFASAAAAIKATQPGGQAGIPTRAIVETFLKQNLLDFP